MCWGGGALNVQGASRQPNQHTRDYIGVQSHALRLNKVAGDALPLGRAARLLIIRWPEMELYRAT